jgi:hypothetical protein
VQFSFSDWALDMERNIDRRGSPKPKAAAQARTFRDILDLHVEDMHEVGRPPRRSTAKLSHLNRERLIQFGRKRTKQGVGPATPLT